MSDSQQFPLNLNMSKSLLLETLLQDNSYLARKIMISHQPLSVSKVERVGRIESYMPNYICRRHGGLSQWGRSNRQAGLGRVL